MKKRTFVMIGAAALAAAGAATAAYLIKRREEEDFADLWDDFPEISEPEAAATEAAEQKEPEEQQPADEQKAEEEPEQPAAEGDEEEKTSEETETTVTFTLKNKYVDYTLGEDKPTWLFVLESPNGIKEIAITSEQYEAYGPGDDVVCRKTDRGYEIV